MRDTVCIKSQWMFAVLLRSGKRREKNIPSEMPLCAWNFERQNLFVLEHSFFLLLTSSPWCILDLRRICLVLDVFSPFLSHQWKFSFRGPVSIMHRIHYYKLTITYRNHRNNNQDVFTAFYISRCISGSLQFATVQ